MVFWSINFMFGLRKRKSTQVYFPLISFYGIEWHPWDIISLNTLSTGQPVCWHLSIQEEGAGGQYWQAKNQALLNSVSHMIVRTGWPMKLQPFFAIICCYQNIEIIFSTFLTRKQRIRLVMVKTFFLGWWK